MDKLWLLQAGQMYLPSLAGSSWSRKLRISNDAVWANVDGMFCSPVVFSIRSHTNEIKEQAYWTVSGIGLLALLDCFIKTVLSCNY